MFWQDVLFALRSLIRTPATAVVAIVTLGLGIGGNTAAFSWTHALLLRPYGFQNLEALVALWERHPQPSGNLTHHGRSASDRNPMAPADLLDLRRQSRSFQHLSAYRYRELYLVGGGEPERVLGVQVTPDLFQTLGVAPALGRALLEEEGRPGLDQVVLLSDGFWRRRFGADSSVLGKEIRLDERAYTIVGVLPAGLQFPLGGVEVWAPLAFTAEMAAQRTTLSLRVVGRLRDSVGLAEAKAEMDALANRLQQAHPLTNEGRSLTLVPLREQQVGMLPPFLYLFHGAAGFVLLIACANVASLLFVRVAARQREMAVRTALGARRWRLVRLVLIESALLSLLGSVLAVMLAWSGVNFIRASLPQDIAKWVAGWKEIRMHGGALGFTLGVAVLAAVVSGLAPALQASGTDLTRALRDGSLGMLGVGRYGVRRLVVVSQLTLALVLTASAALVATGFTRLVEVYQGFDPKGVLTLGIRLPDWRYREPEQIASFYRRLLADLKTVPGTTSAALVSHLPADLGPVPGGGFSIEGRRSLRPLEVPYADFQSVSPAYFQSLRIPVLRGRPLGEEDDTGAAAVVLVSESLARRFWPDGDPLGRRVKLGSPETPSPWLTVVGVVADVKQYWFDREPRPTLYLPYLQAPRRGMFVVLRTAGDPEGLVAAVRSRVLTLDAAQPIEEVRTLERVVAESMAFLRTAARLITSLAILACLLAALGIYGLLGYHVAQSTHDIGVRMALGANRIDVLRLVLGQAAKLAFIGVALGLPAAVVLERILSNMLYGVVGPQPTILGGIAGLLAALTLGAGYIPACRAADQDPAVALRGV